jgi:hypothetical protein
VIHHHHHHIYLSYLHLAIGLYIRFLGRPGNAERAASCSEGLGKVFDHISVTFFKGKNGWMVGESISLAGTYNNDSAVLVGSN